MKKWLYNFIALGIGIILALVLAEIVLRIYNPFAGRVKGNEIVLPANVKYEYKNVNIQGLESHIIHTKNAMGFRGPEWDSAGKGDTRIICVGGSTTECFYLSDGKDWPALMMKNLQQLGFHVWVNNAGLDGHSTIGHMVLLRDHLYRRKPDYIVFLTGCNDIAASGFNKYENYHLVKNQRWLQKSELFNLYHNYRMTRKASKMGLGHTPVSFTTVAAKDTAGWEKRKIAIHDTGNAAQGLKNYAARLKEIGAWCSRNGMVPVFVTQPSILTGGIDPVTGRYIGAMEFMNESGRHYAAVLESYNEVLKAICRENHWHCIDAASALTADSKNYYDYFHYTNKGAAEMAAIVSGGLVKGVLKN